MKSPNERLPRGGTAVVMPQDQQGMAQTERNAWMSEVEHLKAYSAELQAGVRELLSRACGLKDGLWGWFWQCRHCDGRSPDVGLKHQALSGDIEHKADCVVPRMRDLTTPKITPR